MKTERQCYANTRPPPNGALGALIKKKALIRLAWRQSSWNRGEMLFKLY